MSAAGAQQSKHQDVDRNLWMAVSGHHFDFYITS